MANCVAADVRLIINTSLTDTDLGSLITIADSEMSERGFTTGGMLQYISMIFTACMVAMRDPESKSVGEYTEKNLNAAGWQAIKNQLIADLTGSSSGGTTPSGGIVGDLPFLTVNDPSD